MLEKVLAILRADKRLTDLVGDRVQPHHIGNWAYPALVYTDVPLTDDGIVQVDRFEAHIIAKTMADCEAVDRRLRQALLTVGDPPLTADVLRVEINGGGSMEDLGTDTYHKITNYVITCRSVKND